ncbi:MAG: glucose-6-phosphate isomerase, partial [Propionibacteriaceae bacterium]|nr:glucose-6-phosphate isomerase [Propionibacteriaceae bacterium]
MIDCTITPSWQTLCRLSRDFAPNLRRWFADDPQRAAKLTFQVGDLVVDLSKNLVTAPVLTALAHLAGEVDLAEQRDAMFAGERINVTENRSVLHTALRRPRTDTLVVDGHDVVPDVHAVLDAMAAFAHRIRSGEWTGVTGRPIETVVNIGIGGSDLGPV